MEQDTIKFRQAPKVSSIRDNETWFVFLYISWQKKQSSIAPSKENLKWIQWGHNITSSNTDHGEPYHSHQAFPPIAHLLLYTISLHTHTLNQSIYTQKNYGENLTFSVKIENILNFTRKIQQTVSNHNPTACCQLELLHTFHQFAEYNAVAYMLFFMSQMLVSCCWAQSCSEVIMFHHQASPAVILYLTYLIWSCSWLLPLRKDNDNDEIVYGCSWRANQISTWKLRYLH